MNTLDCIATRRSHRKFMAKPIEQEKLDIILKAAQASPISKSYFKGYQISVVRNPQVLADFDKTTAEAWGTPQAHLFYSAPTVIVISAKPLDPQYHVFACDCGCIMENMQLAALELGLGSVFIWGILNRIPQNEAFNAALKLPDGFRPECLLALGYPQEGSVPQARSIEDVPDRLAVNFVD